MSGFLSNNFFMFAQAAGFSPTACRFDSSDTSEMSRTIGTPTNADKWTCSWWQKRTTAGFFDMVFSGHSTGEIYDNIFHHQADNTIRWEAQNGTSSYSVYSTSGYGAGTWRHYVMHYDSGNGTSSDRLNIFINGSQLSESTRYSGHPPSGRDSLANTSGASFNIGHQPVYLGNTNGLFSEFAFIDGSVVAASTFAQDNGGTWSAKEFADNVTFGNNGFYLTFQNASALGEDSSGNDNDFTLSNIASDHQVTDDVPPSV